MKREITIASDVDRDLLMVELAYEGQDCAILYEKEGQLLLELYGRQDGQPWVLQYDELLADLTLLREQLRGDTRE